MYNKIFVVDEYDLIFSIWNRKKFVATNDFC